MRRHPAPRAPFFFLSFSLFLYWLTFLLETTSLPLFLSISSSIQISSLNSYPKPKHTQFVLQSPRHASDTSTTGLTSTPTPP
ncbi:hypothetical protein LZ31DRAFT_245723 [Colletotrichum somersetense]|nr:hypothetical protein LZ31DRAFT_245723 [Colletotrichum somersetense]